MTWTGPSRPMVSWKNLLRYTNRPLVIVWPRLLLSIPVCRLSGVDCDAVHVGIKKYDPGRAQFK